MVMNKRVHNILFHLHTVSSIIISVALFVIFFAGSFSFFRDEIVNWERGHTVRAEDQFDFSVDSILLALEKDYLLQGRDIEISKYYKERRVGISLSASKDTTTATTKSGAFFYMDTKDHTTTSYKESYTLGEFIYRLHFFAQIPYPYGYLLSGFVAFFFLFVIITGILVHWKKIISNFYVFRPLANMKAVWTDSHTILGLIGFPFQLVYAVTGAFFMLKSLLLLPFIFTIYEGDRQLLKSDLNDDLKAIDYSYELLENNPSIDELLSNTSKIWLGFKVNEVKISNNGDKAMRVSISGRMPYETKFNGMGKRVYQAMDKKVIYEKNPLQKASYTDGVKNILYRLHLFDFASLGVRVISFSLGLISCYVILSGVMIWLVARNKSNTSLKRQRFNKKVVTWYMAICLSLYPMMALEFIIVRIFPSEELNFLYCTFFLGWLLMTLFFVYLKDHSKILKVCVLIGGGVGVMIPVINGIMTGNWLWTSWENQFHQILFVDLLWLTLGIVSFFSVIRIKKGKKLFTALS